MKKLLSLLAILGILLSLSTPFLVKAESSSGVTVEEMNVLVEQSTLLLQLKQKVAQIQYRYTMLQENLEMAEKNLEEANQAITDLELIIGNLDEQIADVNRQTLNVKTQKEQKKMDIEDIQIEITDLEAQLEHEKEIVSELMALLYVKRNVYFDANASIDAIKVLASPNSVSETLQSMTYLDMISAETQTHMDNVTTLSESLAEKWLEVREKQDELDTLDAKLAEESSALGLERAHQEEILDETISERTILEAMLSSSDQNEGDLESEIRIYQSNIEMLEKSLAEADALLSEDQRTTIADIQSEMASQFSVDEASAFLSLDWPVSPSGGLSAFFHDSGYQATFGVDHYAVDIRVKQGTAIYAPADGVVQNVVFDPESTRFAYITIAHRKGVSTLYGHISSPAVAIGDYVTREQLIGYSGGAPSTIGAGARTTGPHLHFEVWQDGVRADPLQYLPIEELPLETVPAEYMSQVQSALESSIRDLTESLNP